MYLQGFFPEYIQKNGEIRGIFLVEIRFGHTAVNELVHVDVSDCPVGISICIAP